MSTTTPPPCILYQNDERTLYLVDIPRSLELAQHLTGDSPDKAIISSQVRQEPFPSLEPNAQKTGSTTHASISIPDLLHKRHLELVLEEIRESNLQAWHLPRTFVNDGQDHLSRKRKRTESPAHANLQEFPSFKAPRHSEPDAHAGVMILQYGFFCNAESRMSLLEIPQYGRVNIPPKSTFISGNVQETCPIFAQKAPLFDFVLMDPPWPNRSARRKASYSTESRSGDMVSLLSAIPLEVHLASDALVGVWVTNKPAFRELITDSDGLFERWKLRFEEEWTWLKVTASGEPICPLESSHRKPYETLLLGRRSDQSRDINIKRRVIVGVPDLHSRKPNLKSLIEPMLPLSYHALEIFARNLTAGWWSWGDEVLKFQCVEHWVDMDIDTDTDT